MYRKKRRCLGSADVQREIAQLSTEEALSFRALFADQAEQAKIMEEGIQGVLRLDQESKERDAVLLGTQG